MTRDEYLHALLDWTPGEPLPEPPTRPAVEQVVHEWGDEHAHLVAEQVRAMATGTYDEGYARRAERLAELRTILRDAPEGQP